MYYRELADSQESLSFSKNTQTDGDEQGKGDVGDVKTIDDDETGKHEGGENYGDGKDIATLPTKQWSQSKLKKEYRKFNLDLAPKVIFKKLLVI